MADPDFVYAPRSAEMRARLSVVQRARLGIPEGHCRVYGVHVPLEHAEAIRGYATELARLKDYAAANAFVEDARSKDWLVPAKRITLEKIRKSDPRYIYCPRSPRLIGKMFERIARLMLGVRRRGGAVYKYDWKLVSELLAEGASLQDILTFTGANEGYLKTQLRERGLYRSKRVVLHRDC